MKSTFSKFIFIFLILLYGINGAFSRDMSGSQIAFLEVEIANDSLRLIGGNIVMGQLRKIRMPPVPGDILFEVKSHSGKTTWVGALANPLIKQIENLDEQGELQFEVLKFKRATFTVAVPWNDAIQHIFFYRVTASENRPKARARRILVGHIEVGDVLNYK